MGAVVESWSRDKIKETYGTFGTLEEYRCYTDVTDWTRMPGTTEDGIERQKLIATAIIEKKDRILAQDVVGVWKRDLDPDKTEIGVGYADAPGTTVRRAGTLVFGKPPG